MRFANVLFDLDGTLVDSAPGIIGCIQATLRDLGLTPPGDAELRWCIGPSTRVTFARLLDSTDTRHIEEVVERYLVHYQRDGISRSRPFEGVAAMLSRLKASGARLFVSTSKLKRNARRMLELHGIADQFEAIEGSAPDGSLDDKRLLVSHVLSHHSLAREASVIVGDREHDIVGGKANGLFSLGVTWGYGPIAELTAAGADALCDTPQQVTEFLSAPRR